MIERVTKNEERLDKVLDCIKKLNIALEEFELNQKNINMISKYYGSKNWLKDKDAYEKGVNNHIKAGVLSEDSVWNMLSDVDEIIITMKRIVDNYERNK